MKNYDIIVKHSFNFYVAVDADSEEEAIKIARSRYKRNIAEFLCRDVKCKVVNKGSLSSNYTIRKMTAAKLARIGALND